MPECPEVSALAAPPQEAVSPDRLEEARRVVEAVGVERSHSGGGAGEYFAGLLRRIAEAINLPELPDGAIGLVGTIIAWLAVTTAFGAVIYLIATSIGSRRRSTSTEVPTLVASAVAVEETSDAWARRIDSRLTERDVDGAIEALWAWTRTTAWEASHSRETPVIVPGARSLSRPASWSVHGLIAQLAASFDRQVAPSLRALERLTYGPQPPDVPQIEGIWHELRDALGVRRHAAETHPQTLRPDGAAGSPAR
jgi:hypothetical protein